MKDASGMISRTC
jgi:3-hydroxymyristoyl/3-hydroxydecanoyl-(acyl carrier protein) dehydratase